MDSLLSDEFLKNEIDFARDEWGSLSGPELQEAVRYHVTREVGTMAHLYFEGFAKALGSGVHLGILKVLWKEFWRCSEDAASEARNRLHRLGNSARANRVDRLLDVVERATARCRDECDEILRSAIRVGLLTEPQLARARTTVLAPLRSRQRNDRSSDAS